MTKEEHISYSYSCDICGEDIGYTPYEIDGKYICDDCLEKISHDYLERVT